MRKFFNTKPKQRTTDQRPSPLRRWSFYNLYKSHSSQNALNHSIGIHKSPKLFHNSSAKFFKPQNPCPNSNFSLKKNSLRPILLSSSAFLFTFLCTFVVSSLLTLPSPSHADNLTTSVTNSGHYLDLSSTATTTGLTMSVDASPDGSYASAKDTVTINTNTPNGYSLYLSTSTTNNNLTNPSDPTKHIIPTLGSNTNPAPLNNNSWGYAIPNTTTHPTNFNPSYTTPTPSPDSLWAAVPTSDSPELILDSTSSSSSSSSTSSSSPTSLDIYYGTKVNLSLPSGDYKTTIVYTALTESSSTSTAASISPDYTTNLRGGETVTITTDLSVPQGTDLGTPTVTIGGVACTNPSTTILSSGIVTISCTTGEMSQGIYDVVATIPTYGKTYTIKDGFTYQGPKSYTLVYNANGGTNVPQSETYTGTATTNSHSFTISSTKPIYTLGGYVFKGWATSSLATTPEYTAGQTITLTYPNTTVVLYAVWESNPSITGITTMQQMESRFCEASAVGTSATLKDTRDNKTYTVKKLSDGRCWMTQNLALTDSRTLTPSDSDVTSNFNLPAVDTGTWCTDTNATCYNKALHRTNPDNSSYGAYYNWYAATAGTGTYEKSSGNATSSICPKGWRLPTYSEQNALRTAVGSYANAILTSSGNPGLITSGYYYGSSFYDVGTRGYWWSSTANYSSNAYYLYIYSSSSDFRTSVGDKYSGFSVRCVAK